MHPGPFRWIAPPPYGHCRPVGFPSPDMNELVGARQGDPQSRSRLVERVLPTVVQWCARLGGPKVNAEDAAHDVMIVVITKLPLFDAPGRFGGWLYGVTRRVLARHRRLAWFRRWAPGVDVFDRADTVEGPAGLVEANQTADRVQQALEAVSADHREVLVLADVEERTESEIADLLQLPIGTVRSRTRRARDAFLQVAPRFGLRPTHLHALEGGA